MLPDDVFAWNERWWGEYVERAAIVQYEAGYTREAAERMAEQMVREMADKTPKV
jgi:hypothetical protein